MLNKQHISRTILIGYGTPWPIYQLNKSSCTTINTSNGMVQWWMFWWFTWFVCQLSLIGFRTVLWCPASYSLITIFSHCQDRGLFLDFRLTIYTLSCFVFLLIPDMYRVPYNYECLCKPFIIYLYMYIYMFIDVHTCPVGSRHIAKL